MMPKKEKLIEELIEREFKGGTVCDQCQCMEGDGCYVGEDWDYCGHCGGGCGS